VNTVLVEQIDCTLLLGLLARGFKGVFRQQSVEKLWKINLQNQELPIPLYQNWEKIIIGELFLKLSVQRQLAYLVLVFHRRSKNIP
jgi:hypothetical protein